MKLIMKLITKLNKIITIVALASLTLSTYTNIAHAQSSDIWSLSHATTASTIRIPVQDAPNVRAKYLTVADLQYGLALTSDTRFGEDIYASTYGASPSASAAVNDAAITAALSSLPSYGGTVRLPCGILSVSATINIGNATTTSKSTVNGITLTGCGPGADSINLGASSVSAATRLQWSGTTNGTMMLIQGPVEGVTVKNLMLDANSIAGTGIHSLRSFHQVVLNVQIIQWRQTAITIDADRAYSCGGCGGAGAPFDQLWEMVQVVDPATTTSSALAIGANANVATANTNELSFVRCTFERGSASTAYGVWLGNTDHDTFVHSEFLHRGSTTGAAVVVASQVGATAFPTNITFVATPIIGGVLQDNTAATWSNTIPAVIFLPYYTADSQQIPPVGANSTTLDVRLAAGFTDQGMPLSGSEQFTLSNNQGMATNQVALGLNGILFEGSTSNSSEGFLTVVDPTADITWTLPNVSGTIVTTGDTGTVTSTMLANVLPANTTSTTSQYFTAYNSTTGVYTKAQPAFSDISGTATGAQTPLAVLLAGTSQTLGSSGSDFSLGMVGNGALLRPATSGAHIYIQAGTALSGGSAAQLSFSDIFGSHIWLDIAANGTLTTGAHIVTSAVASITPTIACTGTGTSPSAPTIAGTDLAYVVTINTGTGTPGSTGTCTVTFGTAYTTNAPPTVCMLVKGASTWGNGATIQETTESTSAPVFTWTNLVGGIATALTVSTSYKFSCISIGR